ncbi:MAG TPA: TonB-dependent receptor [Sphingomicrobium sp.]
MTTMRLASLLLISTALVPSAALAQSATAAEPAPMPPAAADAPQAASDAPQSAEAAQPGDAAPPEVSLPGGDVIVTGRRDPNITRSAPQVVTVLTTAEIARTGEGNIAGALGRVTGLSVVGNGYVYVRGLGDRYSLALLNGSPLPSPEPLKRVVPLDLFPSGIIASSLVQKSYSANFPGEFGGGVINLTTKAVPREPFLTFGAGISADSETTNQLGYTYYGSSKDFTGFNNGNRDVPPALSAYFASGERISSGMVDIQAIASELVTGRNAVVQRWKHVAPNFSFSASGGRSFELGWGTLGLIGAAGYSNRWTTRDARNQTSLVADLTTIESDFRRVTTDNRLVANGMLGAGLEFGNNKVRWTNLLIRDTIKNTRLGLGNRHGTTVDFMQQNTGWYERQLLNSQIVAELRPLAGLSVDLRGSFARSKRDAPFEMFFEYARTNVESDPFGAHFVNRLNNGTRGDATISFSKLKEDLWAGSIDTSYKFAPGITGTIGYAFADQARVSSRRDFQFQAPNTLPGGVDLLRPDLLLSPGLISAFDIELVETNEGNPAFDAQLRTHAAYGKVDVDFSEALSLDAGVRWEKGRETVTPVEVFTTPGASLASTSLNNEYVLPAATLTWKASPGLQFRLNASKTIARPQFRELVYQFYFDPDSNRQYRGNPLLVDSQLYNGEARVEYYFGRDQRASASGFYKKIKRPIEAFVAGDDFTTSFANAPEATLHGAELELQKFTDLDTLYNPFFDTRRLLLSANYTYTTSKLKVEEGDKVTVFAAASINATDFFRDGVPLTGQSRHLLNLQLGLEDKNRLSQQTLLVTFASKRVTSRGIVNTGQPDIYEQPGMRLDFVARQGLSVGSREVELKFEARNLTGVTRSEYQEIGGNRIDINSYDLGRTFALSASINL